MRGFAEPCRHTLQIDCLNGIDIVFQSVAALMADSDVHDLVKLNHGLSPVGNSFSHSGKCSTVYITFLTPFIVL